MFCWLQAVLAASGISVHFRVFAVASSARATPRPPRRVGGQERHGIPCRWPDQGRWACQITPLAAPSAPCPAPEPVSTTKRACPLRPGRTGRCACLGLAGRQPGAPGGKLRQRQREPPSSWPAWTSPTGPCWPWMAAACAACSQARPGSAARTVCQGGPPDAAPARAVSLMEGLSQALKAELADAAQRHPGRFQATDGLPIPADPGAFDVDLGDYFDARPVRACSTLLSDALHAWLQQRDCLQACPASLSGLTQGCCAGHVRHIHRVHHRRLPGQPRQARNTGGAAVAAGVRPSWSALLQLAQRAARPGPRGRGNALSRAVRMPLDQHAAPGRCTKPRPFCCRLRAENAANGALPQLGSLRPGAVLRSPRCAPVLSALPCISPAWPAQHA